MTAHLPPAALAAYAAGEAGLGDTAAWSVEAHLERCGDCRQRLVGLADPGLRALLGEAREGILREARTGPQPVPRRRIRRWFLQWADPSLATSAVTTFVAVLAAVMLDRHFPHRPSTVLLLAPVAPLAGLAIGWSRRVNPTWEAVAGTPRAGLELMMRRTLAVLATVLPLLAGAGIALGRNPALWLLPCLTFTAATLLLGSRIGVPTAAALLGGGWLAVAGLRSLVAGTVAGPGPAETLMGAGTMPGWAAAALILALLAVRRADDLRNPTWR